MSEVSVVGGKPLFFEAGKTYARTRVDGSVSGIEFRVVWVGSDPTPDRVRETIAIGFGRDETHEPWRLWVKCWDHWDRAMVDGKPGWVEVVTRPEPNGVAMLVLGRHRPSDDSSRASCTFCHQYTPAQRVRGDVPGLAV